MANIFTVNGQFNLKKLLIAVLGTLAVGFLSSYFTINAREIYQNLIQPAFAPPGWVFGPVWTVLYILMGVAAYRVWVSGKDEQAIRRALMFYIVQLVFNFLWSLLFFGLGWRGLALIEIIVLWALIGGTILQFKKVEPIAAYLLVPYWLWVSFATVLNYAIWVLNR